MTTMEAIQNRHSVRSYTDLIAPTLRKELDIMANVSFSKPGSLD